MLPPGVQITTEPVEWLDSGELLAIGHGNCPDCGNIACMTQGPRGGMTQNYACRYCGAEFNYGLFGGHRNSKKGQPDHQRLCEIFGIVLEK